jgi:hypothetical protein
MRFKRRKWVILNKDEVSSIDFSKVLQFSEDNLRYSKDGTRTFVKYDGDQPDFLAGKEELNHEQMLALYESDWRNE